MCVCVFFVFFFFQLWIRHGFAWTRHGFGKESSLAPLPPPPSAGGGKKDWCRGGGSSFSERAEQWTVLVQARQGWARAKHTRGLTSDIMCIVIVCMDT